MKKSKKNYVLIALVVILIALAVGYASFLTELTINGTAHAKGTWDVKFTEATMSDTSHGTVILGDTEIAVAAELAYPGDGCTLTAKITNGGNVPAKLTGFTLTDENGQTYNNDDIIVSTPTMDTTGSEVIEPDKACTVVFAIQWDKDSKAENVTANFKIKFTYEQAQDATAVTVEPSHSTTHQ